MGGYGGASGRVKDRCYYDSGGNKVTDKNAIMAAEYYINLGMYVVFLQENRSRPDLPRKRRESPLNVGMKRRKNNLHFIPSFFIIQSIYIPYRVGASTLAGDLVRLKFLSIGC
ncbi:MAG: hypothetical protein IJS81_10260 [Selenomonadaceae bacterium]|nr:hypothetical protein [Selenomonadaceae bacterium]